jgi:hypothetical protein
MLIRVPDTKFGVQWASYWATLVSRNSINYPTLSSRPRTIVVGLEVPVGLENGTTSDYDRQINSVGFPCGSQRGWGPRWRSHLPSPHAYIKGGGASSSIIPWLIASLSLPLSLSLICGSRVLERAYGWEPATIRIPLCCWNLDSDLLFLMLWWTGARGRSIHRTCVELRRCCKLEHFISCTPTRSWDRRRCTLSSTTFVWNVTISVFKGINMESLCYLTSA